MQNKNVCSLYIYYEENIPPTQPFNVSLILLSLWQADIISVLFCLLNVTGTGI